MFTFNFFDPVSGASVPVTKELLEAILGGSAGGVANTSITTVGDGSLTAAALLGGVITRSGPTAAFTDTTVAASTIVAALPGDQFQVGQTFTFTIKNNTAWPDTLAAGSGVTLPNTVVVPPFSVAQYFGTVSGTAVAPTVTLTHIATGPLRVANAAVTPIATSVSNTANQTIAAAAIVGGAVLRTTQSAARADTTGLATDIIAASSALGAVGQSFEFTYVNNGLFPITLGGGTGVTVSGATVIPANSFARYLVTRTDTATVSMVAVAQGYFPKVGVTGAANGATPVTVADTRVTANSIVTLTINTVGGTAHGAFVSALTPGTGFTINSISGDTSTYNYKIEG